MHPIRQILIFKNIFRNNEEANQGSINGKDKKYVDVKEVIKLESDTEKDEEEEKFSDVK